MDSALSHAAKLQIPLALVIVAVLAYDAWAHSQGLEGIGAPAVVLQVLALAAGALGIKRPSELAGKVAKDVEDHR